ncbi:hypothetical protein THTE_3804 [Thermogutta terrifontis]|uniref:Uncharacterized protein n=1 Tax=Thermogutta terrifontis TaxID=1331910 RepID=A0A286RKA3_9BACT|nr:hypothetical protein THTE_3804 [Thermogutta terrifontis]
MNKIFTGLTSRYKSISAIQEGRSQAPAGPDGEIGSLTAVPPDWYAQY